MPLFDSMILEEPAPDPTDMSLDIPLVK